MVFRVVAMVFCIVAMVFRVVAMVFRVVAMVFRVVAMVFRVVAMVFTVVAMVFRVVATRGGFCHDIVAKVLFPHCSELLLYVHSYCVCHIPLWLLYYCLS